MPSPTRSASRHTAARRRKRHSEESHPARPPTQICWRNFRGFEDTGWLELRPLTIVIGANNSGKSSLIAPILLLKQTLRSRDPSLPLVTMGPEVNVGEYSDFIHGHDPKRDLFIGVRYHSHPPKSGQKVQPVGSYPPGAVQLTFCGAAHGHAFQLKRYEVFDIYGRPYLTRSLRESGTYTLSGHELGSARSKSEGRLLSAVRGQTPKNFYFEAEPVLRTIFESEPRRHTARLPFKVSLYTAIISNVLSELNDIFAQARYIGPVRQRPRRVFEAAAESPIQSGPMGEYAPDILHRKKAAQLQVSVNRWLQKFTFGKKLEFLEHESGAFSVNLRDGARHNLVDVGCGVSQILPLIVEGFSGPRRSLAIFEQPEIHLNPRAQAVVGDLLAEMVKDGRSVVVETHSEHLLMKVRRLIAANVLQPEDVALYFVERVGQRSTVRQVKIDKLGHIPNEEWPRGFFDDALREALALANEQAKAKGRAHA